VAGNGSSVSIVRITMRRQIEHVSLRFRLFLRYLQPASLYLRRMYETVRWHIKPGHNIVNVSHRS
jgi:hypothetical protein